MALRISQIAVTVVAGLALLFAPAPAGADDPPAELSDLSSEQRAQLESHVKTGKEAYESGNFERSLGEFERAREILDHPDFVYRIALAHERLGNVREAIDAYREFVEMAPDAEERGKVERTIRELEERLESNRPTLEIATDPSGANVYLDGESTPRGSTTMNLAVEPGPHEIRLKRKGFQGAERTVEVERGETVSIQVDLDREDVGEPADTTAAGATGPRTGPVLTLGAGGLFAVGSVVSYTQFARFRRDVREQRECTPTCPKPDGFDSDADSQKTWEGITWTLGSLAVATASAGALWMALGSDQTADDRTRSARRPVVAPMLGTDRVGLQVRFPFNGGR